MNLSAVAVAVLAQADDDVLTTTQRRENLACADDVAVNEGNIICREIFQLTDNAFVASTVGTFVPQIIRTIVILVLAAVATRVLQRVIKRFVRGMNERGIERLGALSRKGPLTNTAPINLKRATMRTETIAGVLRSVVVFSVWSIAVLMILGTFGFNLGPLIAGAGVAGVALGFGAQSLVKDFLSGMFMILEDQFGVGDIIDIQEARGTVEAVTLRTTRLRDISGTLWHIPNGEIRQVGNMSQLWSRALLDIGVAYDTDVHMASDLLKQVADDLAAEPEWGPFFFEPAEVWGVQDFGENEVTIRMVAKVTPAKQWPIERELRARIKAAFDAAGIEIPFPQRTIWVRSGSEGSGPSDSEGGTPSELKGGTPSELKGAGSEGAVPDRGRGGSGGSASAALSPWLGTQSGSGEV